MTVTELLDAIEADDRGVAGLIESGVTSEDLPDDDVLRDRWAKAPAVIVGDARGHSRSGDRARAWIGRISDRLEELA